MNLEEKCATFWCGCRFIIEWNIQEIPSSMHEVSRLFSDVLHAFRTFFCSTVYYMYTSKMLALGVKRYTILLCLLCQFGHSSATLKGISTGWNPSKFDCVTSKKVIWALQFYSLPRWWHCDWDRNHSAPLTELLSRPMGHSAEWRRPLSRGVERVQIQVFCVLMSELLISTVYCLTESHFWLKWWLFLHIIIVIFFFFFYQ